MMMNLEIFLITSMMLVGVDALHLQKETREQGDFRSYIETNHQRSYITVLDGFGNLTPLYFEAHLAPYYMIRLKEEYKWAIELSPQMIIRMRREASFPIRTPSYMPRVTYYHNLYNEQTNRNHLIPFISVVHHSNGQNGDFYTEDGTINTQSGNFATNYLEAGAFVTRLNGANRDSRNYFKSYGAYHFANDSHLKGEYGFFRMNFEYQRIHQLSPYHGKKGKVRKLNEKHRIRQSLQAGWIFGGMNDAHPANLKERLTFRYTLSYHPKIAEDMSIFIQFYYGQDYYNIHFDSNISVLRFGLMTDQLKF